MTNEEKITYTKFLCGDDAEATDALVGNLLTEAKLAILQRRYPFGLPDDADVEPRYEGIQCKLASRYFYKRGAEGETAHNENGINRTYGSVNDEDLLMEITPIAKVV